MKYKKPKASGGMIASTLIQGGASTANVGAGWLLDKYGYKTQPAKYSYSLIGNSRTRAGATTGAYTDLSKTLTEPEQRVKSKDFGLLNTMKTISDIGTSLSSGSGEAVQQGLDNPNKKPTENTAPQLQDAETKKKQMSTDMVSTPDSPVMPLKMEAKVPKGIGSETLATAQPENKYLSFLNQSLKPKDDTEFPSLLASKPSTPQTADIMAGGGKNKKGAVPVEAEGGEIRIKFDDNYNILEKKPIVGASHEGGGVDVKLPKNHAILNVGQQQRLKSGEPLKSILSSLPDVNGVDKAEDGTDNPDSPSLLEGIGSVAGSIWDWGKKTIQTGINTYGAPNYQSGVGGELKYGDYSNAKGSFVPKPTPPVTNSTSEPANKNSWTKNPWGVKLNADANIGGSINFMKGKGDGTIPREEPITKMTAPLNADLWKDININDYVGAPEKVANSPAMPGSLTGDKENTNKFKFGYPEMKAVGDVFSNLLALTQPRPKGVTIGNTKVGQMSFVTPRFLNPKATLDEVGKQINTGVAALTKAGKSDLIPNLIAMGTEATNKVGEQFAVTNAGMETSALSENARASNQGTLTQAGISADTTKTNALLELQRLKQEGLTDTERYKALSNLSYGLSDYQKMKDDEIMRNAVRARLLTSMYMEK